MQRTKMTRELHMKCDICGKEEVLKERPFRDLDYINEGWSRLAWEKPALFCVFFKDLKEYHLCPTCTKKLEKLIKEVKLEEPGPVTKQQWDEAKGEFV
jgi:endogenous inhibitor of DNA gyrase (YacG/DUF329 family)